MTDRAMELLYDSEATLRLVDHELDALREFSASAMPEGAATSPEDDEAPTSSLAMVPMILQRANAEIVNVLQSLRHCRSQLESATTDKLQLTHEKLREVTSATEVAATDILDGLDRAQVLVDDLDADAAEHGGTEKGADLRNRLRDEIFMITGCLQFQDITNQQISYASSVLNEMESRLGEIARMFDPRRYGAPELPPAPAPEQCTFSPDASLRNAEYRQHVADSIFTATTS